MFDKRKNFQKKSVGYFKRTGVVKNKNILNCEVKVKLATMLQITNSNTRARAHTYTHTHTHIEKDKPLMPTVRKK